MKHSFVALAFYVASISYVAAQVANPVTNTVPLSDVFPPAIPTGGVVELDEQFDPDSGDAEANTSSNLSNGTDPDTAAFGEIFIYSPNEQAVSSLDTVDTDWVIPAGVCDPTTEQPQTVPIYCSSNLNTSSCAHVMIGGAANTIVRMPSTCGPGPYARIASLNVHPNPSTLGLSAAQMAQKPTNEPVFLLTFDFDFTAIPEANEPIFMRADLSDMPGYWDDVVDAPDSRRRSVRAGRELGPMIEPRWGGSFTDWLAKLTTLSAGSNSTRDFNWNSSWTIFDQEIMCKGPPVFNATLKAGINGTAAIVLPPSLTTGYFYMSAAPNVTAQFTVAGRANVSYDSPEMTLAAFNFSGLSVPGLITITPGLIINGSMAGNLTLDGQYTATISRNFTPVVFGFGQGESQNGDSESVDTPLNLASANQGFAFNSALDVELAGNLTIHAIPTVQLGINVLNGKLLNSSLFVSVDVHTGVHINGSVVAKEASQFCIGSAYGVAISGGVQNDGPGIVPQSFFNTTQELFSKCFNSSATPATAANATLDGGTPLALAAAVEALGLDFADLSAFFTDADIKFSGAQTGGKITKRATTVPQVPGNLTCPFMSMMAE